jgi:SPP1 family predicted phage head-tail adaptor
VAVRAGPLRHYIRIEKKTIDVSSDGDRTETWTTFAEVWASVETGNGREFFAARQVIADLTHTIRLRYLPGLAPDMRIAYDDQKTGRTRYFDIKSILNPDERDEMLTMQATEVLI